MGVRYVWVSHVFCCNSLFQPSVITPCFIVKDKLTLTFKYRHYAYVAIMIFMYSSVSEHFHHKGVTHVRMSQPFYTCILLISIVFVFPVGNSMYNRAQLKTSFIFLRLTFKYIFTSDTLLFHTLRTGKLSVN